jgi:hypothetical protein
VLSDRLDREAIIEQPEGDSLSTREAASGRWEDSEANDPLNVVAARKEWEVVACIGGDVPVGEPILKFAATVATRQSNTVTGPPGAEERLVASIRRERERDFV